MNYKAFLKTIVLTIIILSLAGAYMIGMQLSPYITSGLALGMVVAFFGLVSYVHFSSDEVGKKHE